MAKPRTKVPLSDEPITQRIHVGGLANSVTPKELVARFSSFGQITNGLQGVSGLGTSSSGLPINYAFFNLETTQAQLNRCISMLNGSMWKSHKLRIQVAKPDWQQRREEERKQQSILDDPSLASTSTSSTPSTTTETKPKTKKRKLSSDPNVGYTAKRFEVVTPSNIENHKGWILDAKPYSSTPLFPLVVRPSHPIYLPPKAAATSWTRGKSSAGVDKKKDEVIGSENVRERREVKRIKRIRIDPRRYGRRKLVYPENETTGGMISVGHWECEDEEEGREGKDEVTWVFQGRNGEVRHRETVKLNQSQQHTDQFKALLEKLQLPQCSKPTQEVKVMEEELAKIPISEEPTMTSARARSLSPPPYVPSAPRQLLYNEEDAFQLLSTTLDEETRLAEVEKERKRLVRLAMGIIDEPVEVAPKEETKKVDSNGRALPKVEGFANDEESDDDVFSSQVLRIRGGAGGAQPEDSDSDSDDSSESEDEKMEEKKEEKPAKTTLVRESLKDMFKPQEEQAASFSLFSGLDLDLNDEDGAERSPSPEPVSIPIPSALPPPLPKILPIYRNQRQLPQQEQDKGPSYSFFGLLGLEGEELEGKRKVENEKRLRESGVEGWWKNQTQEEIDEAHSKLRENLRGFSRKRHRESVKRTKKKGSGAGNRRREGGLGGFTLDSTLAEE